jgi:hypothetical protein
MPIAIAGVVRIVFMDAAEIVMSNLERNRCDVIL